ncbi:MAG: NAD-dependent protein deacetylase [Gammaproteobacteria bacterium]
MNLLQEHLLAVAPDPDALPLLADFLDAHPDTMVLTGAGISTASGIPDYRDHEGVRRGKMPIQGPEFRRDEAVRRRYWARSMVGYGLLARAAPNAAHQALAHLQQRGRIGGLLTQNVDGLHQRAGSDPVLELHGNIHRVVCLDCHAPLPRTDVQDLLEFHNPAFKALRSAVVTVAPDGDAHVEPHALAQFQVPACPYCAGILKPDVVFFGDGVPQATTQQAYAMLERASALLVIGSSLMVYSGFRFCRMAAAAGKPIAAVNIGKTRADELLSLKVAASAERFLPDLLSYLS